MSQLPPQDLPVTPQPSCPYLRDSHVPSWTPRPGQWVLGGPGAGGGRGRWVPPPLHPAPRRKASRKRKRAGKPQWRKGTCGGGGPLDLWLSPGRGEVTGGRPTRRSFRKGRSLVASSRGCGGGGRTLKSGGGEGLLLRAPWARCLPPLHPPGPVFRTWPSVRDLALQPPNPQPMPPMTPSQKKTP